MLGVQEIRVLLRIRGDERCDHPALNGDAHASMANIIERSGDEIGGDAPSSEFRHNRRREKDDPAIHLVVSKVRHFELPERGGIDALVIVAVHADLSFCVSGWLVHAVAERVGQDLVNESCRAFVEETGPIGVPCGIRVLEPSWIILCAHCSAQSVRGEEPGRVQRPAGLQ